MRQGSLSVFYSAVIALLLLTGAESDLSAQTAKNQAKAGRGGYAYGASYETGGERGYRAIMPEGKSCKYLREEDDSRAASVNNGSVEVKYPEERKGANSCKTTLYTVKKGDTIYGIKSMPG